MKKSIALTAILLITTFLLSACFYNKIKPIEKPTVKDEIQNNAEVKKIEPFVPQTAERPIAVMIDNEGKARTRHEGLDKAYIVYEMVTEGGETRLMALFKGVNPTMIGPVRSARHYFIHYALENDAIYIHYGWSPLAQSAISEYKVNNINGITGIDGSAFWRSNHSRNDWQNAFTNIEKLKKMMEKKNYSETTQTQLLAYNSTDMDLANGIQAKDIKLKYAGNRNVEYVYDEESKLYKRFQGGKPHTDSSRKIQYSAKNIIVAFVKSYDLNDGPDLNGVNKGRQQMDDIGEGKGYYITNGKRIDINWKKTSINSETEYTDTDGKEITLNDGQTWIQIVPVTSKITIE